MPTIEVRGDQAALRRLMTDAARRGAAAGVRQGLAWRSLEAAAATMPRPRTGFRADVDDEWFAAVREGVIQAIARNLGLNPVEAARRWRTGQWGNR